MWRVACREASLLFELVRIHCLASSIEWPSDENPVYGRCSAHHSQLRVVLLRYGVLLSTIKLCLQSSQAEPEL